MTATTQTRFRPAAILNLDFLVRAVVGITVAVMIVAAILTLASKKPSRMPAASETNQSMVAEMIMPPPAPPAEHAIMAPPPKTADGTPVHLPLQLVSSATSYTDATHKFIRTANLRIQVRDVYASAIGIEDTAASHGGFVIKNEIKSTQPNMRSFRSADGSYKNVHEYSIDGNLTLRVPSEKMQAFLRALVTHVVFLDQRNFAARDVQFDLLRKQLAMTREHETQNELAEAIGRGGKLFQMTEAITARSTLKETRDEAIVERKELEEQVAFSTIELYLYQPAKTVLSKAVDDGALYAIYEAGLGERLGEKLRGGWDDLTGFVLGLIGAWPLLLSLGLGLAAFRRWRRQRAAPAVQD